MMEQLIAGVTCTEKIPPEQAKLFTPQALAFLTKLHQTFNPRRLELLQQRTQIQQSLDNGIDPDFLPDTLAIRQDPAWRVAPAPRDLQKRYVEITGPTDKKMLINALNSGADVFMADFEDANSPTWDNMVEGQRNLIQAVAGTLTFTNPEGKQYKLNDRTAVLMVRPRGWHLPEKHLLIEGEPISGAFFDFGLYLFHNVKALLKKGSGPYFYLPKLENHHEARLWNDVFVFAQKELGIVRGTIRATVLIETLLAAFEMEEILYELREHSAGLNAGRWDYIFSIIKKFRKHPEMLFPDRSQISMTVPFMRAYTELLVQTCHRRGAHAMGGMAAFVPSRKDPLVNEHALNKVREDKWREVKAGFDGTWVAHPDLVPVAYEVFAEGLSDKPNQIAGEPTDLPITAEDLLYFVVPGGSITEDGLRKNCGISLQYLDAWLCGTGAVAIDNLMEDAATVEISRAQLWQWIHHPHGILEHGTNITPELYRQIADEEQARIQNLFIDSGLGLRKLAAARGLLDQLVLTKDFPDFFTALAYNQL